MNKKEYSINEKREIKKNALAISIGSGIGAALLLTAISCNKIITNCGNKNYAPEKYAINYGNVKVSGEFFEKYDRNSIKIIKTINDEYILSIVDTNNNYYIVKDNEWYIIYLKDKSHTSLICEDGNIIAGEIYNIDNYLDEDEKEKTSFTFEDLINLENKLNNSKTLSLNNKQN